MEIEEGQEFVNLHSERDEPNFKKVMLIRGQVTREEGRAILALLSKQERYNAEFGGQSVEGSDLSLPLAKTDEEFDLQAAAIRELHERGVAEHEAWVKKYNVPEATPEEANRLMDEYHREKRGRPLTFREKFDSLFDTRVFFTVLLLFVLLAGLYTIVANIFKLLHLPVT